MAAARSWVASLLAVLLTVTSLLPDRAEAFGPVCVPHVSNCFCTFQIPCPVGDAVTRVQEILKSERLKQGLELYGAIKNPQAALLKAISGEGSLRIPGLDSIGINASILGDIDPSSLGLNADILKGLASGTLPTEALNQMTTQLGLDPSAIVVPGLTGPIEILGERIVSPGDMVNIPLSQIPGLEGILAGRSSADGEDGIDDTADAALPSSAMCAGPGALISVEAYPHDFVPDVAGIDFFITGGGDLSAYEEAISDGMVTARDGITFGQARAIQARHLLPTALESISTFEEMMEETETLQEDFAINDAVKVQLLAARAETTSLMTSLATVKAAGKINKSLVTPVPLLPHDSEFQKLIEEQIAYQAKHTENARSTRELSEDHARFIRASRDAILHHNLLADAKTIEGTLPGVLSTIEEHEARKSLVIRIEGVIQQALRGLYFDPEAAWERLRPQLAASAGNYLDPGKWSSGRSIAIQLSMELEAQKANTNYGRRLPYQGGYTGSHTSPTSWCPPGSQGTQCRPPFSVIPTVPSQLDLMGQHFGSDDPYRVSPVSHGEQAQYGHALVPVIEVYLETIRRTEFMAELRRGTGTQVMSGMFWEEMFRFAPDCLSGPLPSTPAMIAERPEMFDLSSSCTHLVWTGGDAEDYIPPSALGGADAALWMSKITLDKVRLRTGGPVAAASAARSAIDYESMTRIASRAEELGLPSTRRHTEETLATLRAVIADTEHTRKFDFPRE